MKSPRKTRKDKGKPKIAKWFKAINARRHELIDKMFAPFRDRPQQVPYVPLTDEELLANLTKDEQAEYKAAKRRVSEELHRVHPMPEIDEAGLRERGKRIRAAREKAKEAREKSE